MFYRFIITVIALIVDFDIVVNKREPECASYVLEIIGSILFILISSILIELSLTIISLRGSILNDYPRKPAQYLIYIRLGKFYIVNTISIIYIYYIYMYVVDLESHVVLFVSET